MVLLPNPITQDNFPEVWNIVDAKRRTAKKKYVTSKIASFFSNMVFAALCMIAGNGLIHDHLKGSYCDFLEDIPFLLPVWEQIRSLLLKPDWGVTLQIAVPALAVYAVCFVVCALFVLIVSLLYHPFRRKLPTSTPKENASQLLTMARDARRYSRRIDANGSMFWAFLFMLVLFLLLAMYIVLELKTADRLLALATEPLMKLLGPLTASFSEFQRTNLVAAVFAPSLMLISLALYLAYAFVNHIHAMSVQFMYKFNVPYSFVADVEYYYIFADENTEGLTEEELRAKRREAAEAKRIEALDLERIGAYGKAKELLAAAAHGGDTAAMEHYGRHWLIGGAKDPGKYWLQKCVDTGEAGEYAVKTLRKLKWHLRVRAAYLK